MDLRDRGGGRHFWRTDAGSWVWQSEGGREKQLPLPALSGEFQVANAAGVVAAVEALQQTLAVSDEAIAEGLQQVALAGRFQRIGSSPELVLDVAHNPQAAAALARNLRAVATIGPTVAVFAALGDKDLEGILSPLLPLIEHWLLLPLDQPRALDPEPLRERLLTLAPHASVNTMSDARDALGRARALAGRQGRVVVFGSFFTVAEIASLLEH